MKKTSVGVGMKFRIKTAYQERIRHLLDQSSPLTESEELTLLMLEPLGNGPLEPAPVKRQPYDRLYLKQKRMNEL